MARGVGGPLLPRARIHLNLREPSRGVDYFTVRPETEKRVEKDPLETR